MITSLYSHEFEEIKDINKPAVPFSSLAESMAWVVLPIVISCLMGPAFTESAQQDDSLGKCGIEIPETLDAYI